MLLRWQEGDLLRLELNAIKGTLFSGLVNGKVANAAAKFIIKLRLHGRVLCEEKNGRRHPFSLAIQNPI
jgi:hypothetical protein